MVDNIQTQSALAVSRPNNSDHFGQRKGLRTAYPWLAAILILSIAAFGCSQRYQGTELSGEAADFELMDQNGSMTSLSDFRGKVVILTFMDSKCQDTCPLTAIHFREVYRQLTWDEGNQTIFLGVNANVEASAVSDVSEATNAWHLDEIPNWHFLTGSREELGLAWQEYGVSTVPNPDGHSIMHTSGTFLIDPLGQARWYVSTPFSSEGNTEWTAPLSDLLIRHIREILRER